MKRVIASAGVVALAAVLGWTTSQILSRNAADAFAECRTGNIAGGTIGGPFTLIDETGKTVTDRDVLAKPALVYFGFASCTDVCPLDNARNVQVATALGQDLTPLFISVDPGRDTPELLAEYTDYFGESLIGLTGTTEQVKAAAAAFKVYYQIPQGAADNYQVQHTTLTYLMLPGIGFADFYQRDATAQELTERVGCFLKAH